MSDNNKKRVGSFRKLFPNLFFSHKSRQKSGNKDSQSNSKDAPDPSKGNQYQNPRTIRSDNHTQGPFDSKRIYENITTRQVSDNETHSNEISSNHSSSSTLVSVTARNKPAYTNEVITDTESIAYTHYTARPQVPPKPFIDMNYSSQTTTKDNELNNCDNIQFPDVYYHSLEKLTDKISPLDEIEIYRASQAQANPASVGAEIKRVSTKFLISPKKEAEVRTIQPTRARSLSFDNSKEGAKDIQHKGTCSKTQSVKKPYNYSAPTSPIPISHKIPNMPKTVSPYEHVRKAMIETEEKRNSLSRSSLRNKSTPSPRPDCVQRSTSTLTPAYQENTNTVDKEKTRQKVEAFYWQKLKELKQKEDEYLTRQSLSSPQKNSITSTTYGNSNCSSPNSFSYVMEPRSCSLPRRQDFQSYCMNQPIYTSSPFARGTEAPERRTDTFIRSRNTFGDPGIVYRHPEKLIAKIPMYQSGTLPQQNRNMCQTKRVSFEEQYFKTYSAVKSDGKIKVNDNQGQKCAPSATKRIESQCREPPRPPIRSTSVSSAGKKLKVGSNKRILHLAGGGQSLCSESESGSEAGEIQRILESNAHKGK